MKNEFGLKKIRVYSSVVLTMCALFAGIKGFPLRAERQPGNRTTVSPEARVDINSATIDELMMVPGMKNGV